MVASQLPAELAVWIVTLRQPLHGRLAWRLLPLPRGVLFAQGRGAVVRWLRAAGLGKAFPSYILLPRQPGAKAGVIAAVLLRFWAAPSGSG